MPDEVSMSVVRTLAEQGKIPNDRVAELSPYLEQSPVELRKYLAEQRIVDEATFTQAWASALSLPYADLSGKKIPKEILSIIPESTARGHLIVAVAQTNEALTVAMADPRDRQIVEFIHKKVNMPVQVALAPEEDIRRALTQ